MPTPYYHDSHDPSRLLSPDQQQPPPNAAIAADGFYPYQHQQQQHHRLSPSRRHHPVPSNNARPGPPPHPAANRPPPASEYHLPPPPLPRTSSLLPPPNHVESARRLPQDPNASAPRTNNPARPPVSGINLNNLIPRRSHSRSSSAGPSHEPARLLNRWSASTGSSKTSSSLRRSSARSAHRLSVDAGTWLEHSSRTSVDQSPRKLRKNPRRSISTDATGIYALDNQPPPPRQQPRENAAHLALPPIEPLSSLEDSIHQDFAPLRSTYSRSPDPFGRPSRPSQPPGSTPVPAGTQADDGDIGFSINDMPYDRGMDAYAPPRGHSRNRSQTAKGSTDSSSSVSRERSTKQPSQKAMLSRALQRANTAVQLDNAQNYEGARQSYAEACDLLSQVLIRTSTDEDKRKLEAIRQTYTSRIVELDQMEMMIYSTNGKALPARPESLGLQPGPAISVEDDEDEPAIVQTATLTRIIQNDGRPADNQPYAARRANGSTDLGYDLANQTPRQHPLQSSFSRSREYLPEERFVLQRPAEDPYMPPPLSPRRPRSPQKPEDHVTPDMPVRTDFSMPSNQNNASYGHGRAPSRESNSWLDPINESGGSSASSIHSRTSSFHIRRRQLRPASGDTEAEFDAALDAAVEAAYDDGYELMDGYARADSPIQEDVVARAMHRVQLAKERVRETEREVFEEAQRAKQRKDSNTMVADFYDDGSSEDEERILEEMTRSLAADDFGRAPSRALPRESDSSGFTSRTWHSSQGSNPPTATTLSTVIEPAGSLSKNVEPPAPPPSHALPQLPPKPGMAAPRTQSPGGGQSVRNRRLSGQNPKQLKIEVGKGRFGAPGQLSQIPADELDDDEVDPMDRTARDKRGSEDSAVSPTTTQPPPALASPVLDSAVPEDASDRTDSPVVYPPTLRKNYSSSSLRSLRSRNMSATNLDEASDLSPSTPLSNGFNTNSRMAAMPPLPTPLAAAFGSRGGAAGGLHLFDDTFHTPKSPGSPTSLLGDSPAMLEPCPNDYMLRPFWLMRCLYQTLVHPRGGYLSNKLFIPREVWKVKGVKLRNLEDKISSCDYLTAALMKLAKVDTLDADAVLEEMQSLEGVLEQVQATLTRKLGLEVGVQGTGSLFNQASTPAEMDIPVNVPRSASISGKSSFSWRRLRSKNSGANLASSYNLKTASLESGKESPTVDTLPMTANPTSRPAKRDVSSAAFTGPNASYMGSLARLFDAAQAIDQIARQVEDPGLRHADKTQVGLELCTRHAAEFFGFYICRFVLSDVGILLDKFIKRSSEWVLT